MPASRRTFLRTGLTAAGAAALARPSAAAPPEPVGLTGVPGPDAQGGRVAYCGLGPGGHGVHVITPAGRHVARVTDFGGGEPQAVRLSRDGGRVVVLVGGAPGPNPSEVRVYDLARPGRPLATLCAAAPHARLMLAWGADDNTVYVNREVSRPGGRGRDTIAWAAARHDVAAGTEVALGLPADHAVMDASPCGRRLLVLAATRLSGGAFDSDACVADVATLKLRRVGNGVRPYRFAPGGDRVMGVRGHGGEGARLVVLGPGPRDESEIRLGGRVVFGAPLLAGLSPDGERVLIARQVHAIGAECGRQRQGGSYLPTVGEMFACALDGSQVTPVFGECRGPWLDFDWR